MSKVRKVVRFSLRLLSMNTTTTVRNFDEPRKATMVSNGRAVRSSTCLQGSLSETFSRLEMLLLMFDVWWDCRTREIALWPLAEVFGTMRLFLIARACVLKSIMLSRCCDASGQLERLPCIPQPKIFIQRIPRLLTEATINLIVGVSIFTVYRSSSSGTSTAQQPDLSPCNHWPTMARFTLAATIATALALGMS